jgi:hypothetical protein
MKRPATTLCRSSRWTWILGTGSNDIAARTSRQNRARKKTAKTSLSDATMTTDSADEIGANSAIARAKNDNSSNDMVTLTERVPDISADRQNTNPVRDEIRAPRHRGGGPEDGANFGTSPVDRHDGIDVATLGVGSIIAAVAADFQLRGMAVLFPGTLNAIIAMAVAMGGREGRFSRVAIGQVARRLLDLPSVYDGTHVRGGKHQCSRGCTPNSSPRMSVHTAPRPQDWARETLTRRPGSRWRKAGSLTLIAVLPRR